MKYLYIIILLFYSLNVFSQKEGKDTITSEEKIIDTLETINLKEITIYEEKDREVERIKRYRIRKRLKKIWKYVLITQSELRKLDIVLSKMKSKSRKKKYKKLVEKFIRKNFEETLKKFYIQDGQIMLKMIYRQFGRTAYEITKELRSGWTAFWWNSTAFFFEMSLKSEYHPTENKEDFLIEKYLQELFDEGLLDRRPAFDECKDC